MSSGFINNTCSRAFNAPQAVAKTVNRGVELIVAAQGDQPVAAGYVLEACRIQKLGRGEFRFAGLRLPDTLASLVALVEAPRLPHAFLITVEHLGIGLLNLFPDQCIVADPLFPLQFRIWR